MPYRSREVCKLLEFSMLFFIVFSSCFSDEEIASFPIESICLATLARHIRMEFPGLQPIRYLDLVKPRCLSNRVLPIITVVLSSFFKTMRKVWNFCVPMASYPPAPIVNSYVLIEETKKHGVVEKGLVWWSKRKQRAALPFRTLNVLFCIIPIFCPGKLCYLLTTISAISETTGLCWNA